MSHTNSVNFAGSWLLKKNSYVKLSLIINRPVSIKVASKYGRNKKKKAIASFKSCRDGTDTTNVIYGFVLQIRSRGIMRREHEYANVDRA